MSQYLHGENPDKILHFRSSEPSLLCLRTMLISLSDCCWLTFGSEALLSAGKTPKMGASGVVSDVVFAIFSLNSNGSFPCLDDVTGELNIRFVVFVVLPVPTLLGSGPSTFRPLAPVLSFHSLLMSVRKEKGLNLGGLGTVTS